MSRGTERRSIFADDHDRRHFLELLKEAVKRYRVRIHAYVLMSNHFHLLIETPEANQAAFMQWVKLSYAMWYNVRHDRVGSLFQGRYRSIPVEDASWIYELSLYMHLNPLRLARFKLSRIEREGESREPWKPLGREEATRRLRELRTYRWSSYRHYAGYESAPAWLTTLALIERAGSGRLYRKEVMKRLTAGEPPDSLEHLRDALAIGAETFKARMKAKLREADRETENRREGRKKIALETVISVVEKILGEPVRREKWGGVARNIVLKVARDVCGMTLKELGAQMGGIDYVTVHSSIRRLDAQVRKDKKLREKVAKIETRLQNAKI
jgi:REP element-mobilizing transposase RayT